MESQNAPNTTLPSFSDYVEDRKYLKNVSPKTLSWYADAWKAFGPITVLSNPYRACDRLPLMRRWMYWCFVIPLYWFTVVHVLRGVSPVFVDGSGPMPSFYWSKHMPTPGLSEYYRNRSQFDRLFSIPYYVAGLILTIVGCVIGPEIARHRTRTAWRMFMIASTVTLMMLLAVAVTSDVGGIFGCWNGPRILLMRSFSAYDVFVLAKVFLLASILSGGVTLCRILATRHQSNSKGAD